MGSPSRLAALLIAALLPQGARAGSLRGKVVLAPRALAAQLERPEQVVVLLEDAKGPPPAAREHYRIRQIDKAFDPAVLLVPQGATVEFLNGERLDHNVFSPAREAPFDLGIFPMGQSRLVRLDKPGLVPVYCNLHPNMIAWVVVLANRFAARPAADGSFTLEGVPEGDYTLLAWSPFSAPMRKRVRVGRAATDLGELVVRERGGGGRHPDKTGRPYSPYPAR